MQNLLNAAARSDHIPSQFVHHLEGCHPIFINKTQFQEGYKRENAIILFLSFSILVNIVLLGLSIMNVWLVSDKGRD